MVAENLFNLDAQTLLHPDGKSIFNLDDIAFGKGHVLGRGSVATVYKAMWHGRTVAVKMARIGLGSRVVDPVEALRQELGTVVAHERFIASQHHRVRRSGTGPRVDLRGVRVFARRRC